MSNFKSKRVGYAGTIFFHIGLLALLFYLGFHTPLPLPGEEGILVNFGNLNQEVGKKDIDPSWANETTTTVPKPEPTQVEPAKPSSSANEKILTQDIEEAPSVPSSEEIIKKKEEVEKKKKIKGEQDRLIKIEKEKKRQEELKQKREAETVRKRLAEIERKRKKEAERQEKITAINNKAKNIFSPKTSNPPQSKTFPSQNQGSPNGSPNSDNYSGTGLGSKGYSYDLKGRNSLSIPKPKYNLQESGKVVVEITVDRNGKVVNARPGMPGSTTSNSILFEAARKAAMKAIFNSDPKASAFQQGTITYHFLLD